jgi:DeoR/GlpR family transcriptional regulator of sugar metabolism
MDKEAMSIDDSIASSSHQERMKVIFQILSQKRTVRVAELQDRLGVSDMTVRRCLNAMAGDGLIRRFHGGAAAIEGGATRFLQIRHSLNTNIKTLLADRAMDFLHEGGSVFLDAGTTCFTVAKRLAAGSKKMNVFTDSLNVARALQRARHLNTMLLGGTLCDDLTTVEGPLTIDAASRINLDICLFSADAFNEEHLAYKYLAGAMTKKMVIPRSRKSMFICDSSKYNQRRCFMFCGWEEVDIFLTDSFLPAKARRAIVERGVELHVVSEPARTEDCSVASGSPLLSQESLAKSLHLGIH